MIATQKNLKKVHNVCINIVSVLPRNWPRCKGRVEFLPTSEDLRSHPHPTSKYIEGIGVLTL